MQFIDATDLDRKFGILKGQSGVHEFPVTGHSKMLAVLVLGPGKDRGGSARCVLRWLKRFGRYG